jgi:hypothetical protein
MVRGERQPNFRYGLRTVVEGSGVKATVHKNYWTILKSRQATMTHKKVMFHVLKFWMFSMVFCSSEVFYGAP